MAVPSASRGLPETAGLVPAAAFGSPQPSRPVFPVPGGTAPEASTKNRGGSSYRATPKRKALHMPSTSDRVTPGPLTRTRTRDPLTSMNAAAAITPIEQTKVKDAIEAILTDLGPLTDDDIYAAYVDRGYPRRTATRVRTARSEMTKLDTPTRVRAARLPDVKLPSGHFAQRWELIPTDENEEAAAA